ncbi:unnamed protein product [Onchocerca flexuosa]|uniref:Uncharacterized protein n=1 Tax=Onchocerca flexuosa TaxID=387005 RepID=A0A183HQC1_9BILA|nr:unnamed protein product [Onchocerca flexuosa]
MGGISQQNNEKIAVIEAWKVVKILRSETTMRTRFNIVSIDALCKSSYLSIVLEVAQDMVYAIITQKSATATDIGCRVFYLTSFSVPELIVASLSPNFV